MKIVSEQCFIRSIVHRWLYISAAFLNEASRHRTVFLYFRQKLSIAQQVRIPIDANKC